MTRLIYDGSFDGLLSAIFDAFDYKLSYPEIVPRSKNISPQMFAKDQEVFTAKNKAQRLSRFLEEKMGKRGFRTLLLAFLSESDIEQYIYHAVFLATQASHNPLEHYADERILHIHQTAKSVSREKHRMEAFLRFELMKDGIYAAKISPDFNVCGLIVPHFKNRYQDQQWMIYDILRDYGFFWDGNEISDIYLDNIHFKKNIRNDQHILHEEEAKYQTLWQSYFRETNIQERKNMKLHLQHVPRRYWRYLTEKWQE